MNEDGDWWVPVEGVPFREARALIVSCLADDFPLAYLGKQVVWLDSEHESGCETDCPTNRHVNAYHFEERHRD